LFRSADSASSAGLITALLLSLCLPSPAKAERFTVKVGPQLGYPLAGGIFSRITLRSVYFEPSLNFIPGTTVFDPEMKIINYSAGLVFNPLPEYSVSAGASYGTLHRYRWEKSGHTLGMRVQVEKPIFRERIFLSAGLGTIYIKEVWDDMETGELSPEINAGAGLSVF
jgi:hypothetical protein